MNLSPQDIAKLVCASNAAELVQPGMKVGLGTGSTAEWLVKCLALRAHAEGLRFDAAATSIRTAGLAEDLGLSISSLDTLGRLDLTIDGADEFDPNLNLIKGAGGALLVEKIVATASNRMVVITDKSKQVDVLGAGTYPLPIEVIQYGHETTARLINTLSHDLRAFLGKTDLQRRLKDGGPVITDEGHFLYDLRVDHISDPSALSEGLLNIPGVVETGLFLGIADEIVVGEADGRWETIAASGPVASGTLSSPKDLLKDLEAANVL